MFGENLPETVLFTGDRNWNNVDVIQVVLSQLDIETSIVHGACRGLDRLVDTQARLLGFQKIHPCPANWALYGKAAGVLRNREMLTTYTPTTIIAFHDEIKISKGTKNMCIIGLKEKVSTYLITSNGEVKQLTLEDLK